jgi:hypothetical protein
MESSASSHDFGENSKKIPAAPLSHCLNGTSPAHLQNPPMPSPFLRSRPVIRPASQDHSTDWQLHHVVRAWPLAVICSLCFPRTDH